MDAPQKRVDGRLCCDEHHRTVCLMCHVDYRLYGFDHGSCSFAPAFFQWTGRQGPTVFSSPSDDSNAPQQLFVGRKAIDQDIRYVHAQVAEAAKKPAEQQSADFGSPRVTLAKDMDTALLYTAGACVDHGRREPRAGWAFCHGVDAKGRPLVVSGPLEEKGPFGDVHRQTSSRAELRAVLAALRYRDWSEDGFHTIVFATDSELVVNGSTQWAWSWFQNDWRTRNGRPVQNQDLWDTLMGEVERLQLFGTSIQFWRIPREWNPVADQGAKNGAQKERKVSFEDVLAHDTR